MSSPEEMPHLDRGVVIAGKYRLVEPLERGGMGAVWVAHHQDLGVDVALKFVLPDVAARTSGHARFRREARAAARLKSPHTAQIYDYGVDRELAYIAMELLEGHHLGSELKQQSYLSPARVAAICSQVAKALGEAHAAGIVHRDVKPPNIFLAQVAGEEIVKLLDFGIAKVLAVDSTGEHVSTDTGTMLGTPRYMSPEQACGDPIDFRSDLFSLAVVAFEALTGQRLFTAQHLGELVVQVTNAKVPPLQSVRSGLPAQLDAFFAQATAVNPELRFQSAAAFAAALTATCAGEPVPQPGGDDDTLDVKRPAAALAKTKNAGSEAATRVDKRDGAYAATEAAASTVREPRQAGADTHVETATTSVTSTTRRAGSERDGRSRARRWAVAAALLAAGGAVWWGLSAGLTTAPVQQDAETTSRDSASPQPSAIGSPDPEAPAPEPQIITEPSADASAEPRPSASATSPLSTATPALSAGPPHALGHPQPNTPVPNAPAGTRPAPTAPAAPRPAPPPLRPQPIPVKPKPRDGIFDPRPKR